MRFELGKYYAVLKTDGTIITFKFVGGETPCVEINGEYIPLNTILIDGFQAYWEVQINLS